MSGIDEVEPIGSDGGDEPDPAKAKPLKSGSGIDSPEDPLKATLQEHEKGRLKIRRWFGGGLLLAGLAQGMGVFWCGIHAFHDFFRLVTHQDPNALFPIPPSPEISITIQLTFVIAHAALILGGMLFAYWLGVLGARLISVAGDESNSMPHETAFREASKLATELAKALGGGK